MVDFSNNRHQFDEKQMPIRLSIPETVIDVIQMREKGVSDLYGTIRSSEEALKIDDKKTEFGIFFI